MKIGMLPSPSPTTGSPLQERFGADQGQPNDDFAALLAAMLATAPGDTPPTAGFPQLALLPADPHGVDGPEATPRIGAPGEAFVEARLLRETALAFRGDEGSFSGHRAFDIFQACPQAGAYTPGQPAIPAAGPHLAELLAQWIEPAGAIAAPPFDRAPPAAHALPTPPPVRGPLPPAETPMAKPALDPGTRRSERPQVAEPAAPSRPAARNSAFGAQLFALETGLRLVLRLPRLADGERDELTAGLARLFESFGHWRHEIVIRELMEGQG